jgi:Fur family transcriptional regulator, peroxide stress response regulator
MMYCSDIVIITRGSFQVTSKEQVEKRVADFLEICRRQGVKATHQRTEILRELTGSEEHPDAETILVRVRQKIPAISVDTIYRTLRLLEDSGVIARVGSIRDRTRFDANTDRHHHFVCTECGMIGDFYSDAMDRLPVPREVSEMGSIAGVYVELRGVCRKCKQKATQTEARTKDKS